MDRKSFFRNLLGAAAAVTISPVLEKISIAPAAPQFITRKVGDNVMWMSYKEYVMMQKWYDKQERRLWGLPDIPDGDNKRI